MTLKTLIVDDSKLNRDLIRILVNDKFPMLEICGEGTDVNDSVSLIDQLKPDLIFMDIQLKNGTGFDVMSKISYTDGMIVFITAYSEYALKALKQNALDYILKPINFKDLQAAVDKAFHTKRVKLQENAIIESPDYKINLIRIITNRGSKFINERDVYYLKADGKYTEINTENEGFVSSKNLKQYELKLNSSLFYRIHHSYLVNIHKIKNVNPALNLIVLENDVELPISVRKKEEFLRFIA